MSLHLALSKLWPAHGGRSPGHCSRAGDLRQGGHDGLIVEEVANRKTEGVKFKLFKLIKPKMHLLYPVTSPSPGTTSEVPGEGYGYRRHGQWAGGCLGDAWGMAAAWKDKDW